MVPCFQLYLDASPFHNKHKSWYELCNEIVEGVRPKRPTTPGPNGIPMADELWSLTKECWHQQAMHRPPASQVAERMAGIVEHTFQHAHQEQQTPSFAPEVPSKDQSSANDAAHSIKEAETTSGALDHGTFDAGSFRENGEQSAGGVQRATSAQYMATDPAGTTQVGINANVSRTQTSQKEEITGPLDSPSTHGGVCDDCRKCCVIC